MNWKFWNKEAAVSAKAKPKSKIREWWDAILFAVIAATLIRWLIMEAYTIPTPSMENSLLVGDFLFVSKFHYGTRTTTTPLQVPLTHQKIWFTNLKSYSEAIRLPQYRLPGLSNVQREDVVVFNVPPKGLNDGIDYPVDLKTNYIKRCVGIPGDSLKIVNKQVYANGTPVSNPPDMQFSYNVISSSAISERNLDKLGLGPEDIESGSHQQNGTVYYEMWLTKEKADEMKALPYIKSVIEKPDDPNIDSRGILPYNPLYFIGDHLRDTARLSNWTANNFGPVWIPKEGATIPINRETLALYGTTIALYDHNEDVKVEGDKLTINGQEVKEYTFRQNYYFMMGDNRHNSLDSRYWGFVPEDHIVGKAFFIWLSLDQNAGALNKIRWSRFFKLIE
jgi:signal peptidase I